MAGFIKATHDVLDTVSHSASAIAKGAKFIDAHMQFLLDEQELLAAGKLKKIADDREELIERWYQETYGR